VNTYFFLGLRRIPRRRPQDQQDSTSLSLLSFHALTRSGDDDVFYLSLQKRQIKQASISQAFAALCLIRSWRSGPLLRTTHPPPVTPLEGLEPAAGEHEVVLKVAKTETMLVHGVSLTSRHPTSFTNANSRPTWMSPNTSSTFCAPSGCNTVGC
jgi:hypothetical protein